MRSEEQVTKAIAQYSDTVKRICFVHLKNEADTQDIFQTVFLKYALSQVEFESPEHEKAWLIRVAINACKDLLKSFFRTHTVSLDEADYKEEVPGEDYSEVMEALLRLPEKYRRVIYLHYYEEYTAPQISKILGKNVNTVYTLLARAKNLLRKELGAEKLERN